MICCLCGESIRPGDITLVLTRCRFYREDEYGRPIRGTLPFEDGSAERITHDLCPVLFGAPMSLVGVDGSRPNG
jgi:hypothetical protein